MVELRHRGDLPLPGAPGKDAPAEGHFGLLLDKLAAYWVEKDTGGREIDGNETLRRLIGFETVTNKNKSERRPRRTRTVALKEQILLEAQHARLDALVAARGRACTYRTLGPLAIGMGNSSPLENGLTVHPTYGVPYIPGSAIKGMLSAWCEDWLDKPPAWFEQGFGRKAAETDARRIGELTFLDALPCPPVKIMVDVMTPHAGPYYSDPLLPPADWHSPNPIPFLVVPEGRRFCLRYVVNGRASFEATQEHHLDEVERLLGEALATVGIGGKTAAGYGRLQRA